MKRYAKVYVSHKMFAQVFIKIVDWLKKEAMALDE